MYVYMYIYMFVWICVCVYVIDKDNINDITPINLGFYIIENYFLGERCGNCW